MSWKVDGYEIGGNVGELIGSLAGAPAIVAGGAETVFEEYTLARKALPEALIFTANDIGMYLPVVHHMVSLHSDKLIHWSGVRHCDFPTHPWKTHSRASEDGGIDHCWLFNAQMGLSGYFAAQIAYAMGAGLIVLAGCPGDRTRRFFDGQVRQDYDYQTPGVREQLEREMQRVPGFRAKLRSLGGWTKQFLGELD